MSEQGAFAAALALIGAIFWINQRAIAWARESISSKLKLQYDKHYEEHYRAEAEKVVAMAEAAQSAAEAKQAIAEADQKQRMQAIVDLKDAIKAHGGSISNTATGYTVRWPEKCNE